MATEHSNEKSMEQLKIEMQVMEQKLVMMNEKLLASEKSKSVFLAKVRDEINNPLTTLLFFANELSQYKGGNPKLVRSMGSTVFRDMFILDLQLQNIILSSELESGILDVSNCNVNILNMMQERISGMEILSKDRKELTISLNIDSELRKAPFFATDPGKLQSIFDNLVANAVEYTPDKGTITVASWRSDDQLFIKVHNEGRGLDSINQNHLFDRFREVSGGAVGHHKGQGLGLAVMKGLTEFLGGVVLVETSKGKGSTFTINIPEYKDGIQNFIEGATFFSDDEMELF